MSVAELNKKVKVMNYIDYMLDGSIIKREIVYLAPNKNTIEAVRFKPSGLIKTIKNVIKEYNDKNRKVESSTYPDMYNQGYFTTATPKLNYLHYIASRPAITYSWSDLFTPINKQRP